VEALNTLGDASNADDAGKTRECFGGGQRHAVKRAIFDLFRSSNAGRC